MNKGNFDKNRLLVLALTFVLVSAGVLFIFPTQLIVPTAEAASSWTQTTNSDFNSGTLENISVVINGSSAELILSEDEGSLIQNFGTGGAIVSSLSPDLDFAYSIALDSSYIYVAGSGNSSIFTDGWWQIEKRNKSTGALVPSFDGDGIVISNASTGIDEAHAIAVDENYIYIAGYDRTPGNSQWRIEKRNKSSGALVPAFDGDGIVVNDPNAWDRARAITVDSEYIYIAGYDDVPGDRQWRIEKRNKTTGVLVTAFDGDGVAQSNPSSDRDTAYAIDSDSNYIYIAGCDDAPGYYQWRIEKRNKTTGALVNAFDSDGVVLSDPQTNRHDVAYSLVVDSSSIYIAGYDYTLTDTQWRVEKRNKTTGALVTAFDGDGVAVNNPSTTDDEAHAIALYSNHIYIAGYDRATNDPQWHIEKRNKTTGALVPAFNGDGVVQSNPTTGGDEAHAIAVDSSGIYIAGIEKDTIWWQWRIEKRGINFENSGNFLSSVFDSASVGTFWNSINWSESLPAGTDITLATRTGDTTSPDGTWSTWSSELIDSTGSVITSPRSRFIQYRAKLSTSAADLTPILKEVTVTYTLNTVSTPILTGPADNLWLNPEIQTFTWMYSDDETDPQGVFRVEIDDNSDFSSVDYTSGNVISTASSWSPNPNIAEGVWYWRVRTQDSYGMSSDYSSTRIIKIDVTPPTSFVPSLEPYGWTTNTQPVLTFSTTDAVSGVDYYEVSIDNETPTKETSPYTLPAKTEGIHNISVLAYDLAGNYQEGFIDVYIDLTPPENLIISADPGSWSNNTETVVTFSASDEISGIDHYELTIDSGIFSPQTSPYTLPKLSDGIHTVTVQAYDKANNYVEGAVEVYIDTKPPIITHTPINIGINNTPVTVTAIISDGNSGIDYAKLFFKYQEDTVYSSQLMNLEDSVYSAIIPRAFAVEEGIGYYIKAVDRSSPSNIAYFGVSGLTDTEPTSLTDIDILIPKIDETHPIIIDKSPTGTNVLPETNISVTFSEPMVTTDTENDFSILPEVEGKFRWEENKLVFDPVTTLEYDIQYIVTIGTNAKDLANNTLETKFAWDFTTIQKVVEIEPDENDNMSIPDVEDEDTDEDGFTNQEELEAGTDPYNKDDYPRPPIIDTDNDGEADDVDTDDDNDGISDIVEIILGTNPLIADTDEDGYEDGSDDFPLDSTKSKNKISSKDSSWASLIAIIIIIIVAVLLIFVFIVKPRMMQKNGEKKPEEETQSQQAPTAGQLATPLLPGEGVCIKCGKISVMLQDGSTICMECRFS